MRLPIGMIALVFLAPAPVMAASAPPAAPPAQEAPVDELDEVLVEGRRNRVPPTSWDYYQQSFDFLARLVGQFAVAGQVDLGAQGNSKDLRKVTGRALCLGFGAAPGVQCEMSVRWPETRGLDGEEIPGGVSALNPAVLLFGYEPVTGISHVVVDNKGIADVAVGQLASPNTMVSRSKCVGIPGNCERTVRITAEPDLKTIRMNIDLAIEDRKAVSYQFVLQREAGTKSVVHGRKQEKEKKKK